MFKTRMTELLGIDHPIQCGTMQWLSKAELVASVANAGAFACLSAATFENKEKLADEIKRTKDLTDKPFGVNVSLLPTLRPIPYEEMIETIIKNKVTIIETAGRNPEPYREQISGGGLIHIHKCARVRDAIKVERLGLDAVAIVGFECAGHPSMDDTTTLIKLPLAADAVSIPVIAGGGFCDGRSLLAALTLGAEGVVMGTRFLLTEECPVERHLKEKMVLLDPNSTLLTLNSLDDPVRVVKNKTALEVLKLESKGVGLEGLMSLITGLRSREAWAKGDFDSALLACGQVIGRIGEILPVHVLIERIITEAEEVKKKMDSISA